MNYRHPVAPPQYHNLTARRYAMQRHELKLHMPSRNEACQHQATAEYQAARLKKRLKEWLAKDQSEVANTLLNEVINAYELALTLAIKNS